MGRHVDLLHPGLLESLVAVAFACVLGLAYLSCCPQVRTVEVEGEAVEQVSGQSLDSSSMREDEGEQEASSESEPDPQPEPEPEPLVPKDLAAGSVLTNEEIELGGGTDAFFWAEEIPDEVFARMEGKSFGADCTMPRSDLRYVRVLHKDADKTIKVGELVVHRNVADEILDIFRQLYGADYPIRKMHLVDDYDADDDRSCADDNTSAFNYRTIAGTSTLSNHAYGLAIDINTFENPYCVPARDYVSPDEARPYADRSLREPYMIHSDDLCYQLFVAHGWSWGGNWESPKDYQHFEKPDALWY